MNKEESVPVAVSVSSYGVENTNNSVTNVYAKPMTSGGNTSNPTSVPTITAIGYASPPSQPASVRAQALPSSQTPLHVGGLHLEQPFHVDERVLRATTSARSVKCLTVLDLCLILLITIFQFSWIFLVWGPFTLLYGSVLGGPKMECDVFNWSEEEWCESDESNYCEENKREELKSEKKKFLRGKSEKT